MIPGYEDYDERTHCLQCDKPGTGAKDAPRAFSLKLATVTRSEKVGLVPTTYDPELEVKHRIVNGKPKLVLMVAKHVDDLKITGEKSQVTNFLNELEQVFGTPHQNDRFVYQLWCKTSQDGTITLDQDDYIKALIPIIHKI